MTVTTDDINLMKPVILLILGVAGLLVGLGFVFPAVAQWRDVGAIGLGSGLLLGLGLVLTAAGVVAGAAGINRLRS